MKSHELVTLAITEEHIEAARAEPCWCPIVRAFMAVFPIETPWNIQVKDLPEEAHTFIRDFDRGREVKPFTFTVRVIDGRGRPHARYRYTIKTQEPAEPSG